MLIEPVKVLDLVLEIEVEQDIVILISKYIAGHFVKLDVGGLQPKAHSANNWKLSSSVIDLSAMK